MPEEPNLAGTGFKGPDMPIGVGVNISLPQVPQAASELRQLSSAVDAVKASLMDLANKRATIVSAMREITAASKEMGGASGSIGGVASSFSSVRSANNLAPAAGGGGMGGDGGGGGYSSYNGGGGGAYSSGGGIAYSGTSGSLDMKKIFGGATVGGIGGLVTRVLQGLTIPVRYMHDRVEENRRSAGLMAEKLGATSTLSGETIGNIIEKFASKQPVYGSMQSILDATDIGARAGYNAMGTDARSGAFYANIRQQQAFAPGAGAGELAQKNVELLSNTRVQQRAMMFTGGAMSSFGPGGVPKTLQEWSESILKFFQGQRPGKQRGKEFSTEELQTQYFPGSNMNAWFETVGVPQYMQDFFWQYAIGKSRTGTSDIDEITSARGNDLAKVALQRESQNTRRDFGLASTTVGMSKMYDKYVLREKADREFSRAMGVVDKGLLMGIDAGAKAGTFGLGGSDAFSALPTPIAEMLYNLEMDMGPQLAGLGVKALTMFGDPDTGWGDYGGTGFIGMDPSFAGRLKQMMADNPNLTITSGYRDGPTQERLYNAGMPNVAPPGQSFHSKGLAADLGPASEFGWIAANAHRYGLENAAHMGEPWHVGAPGTVPVGDPRKTGVGVGDLPFGLEGVKDAISSLANIAKFAGSLMGGITSLVGGDFGPLFGSGGPFDKIQDLIVGGFTKLLGLPDFSKVTTAKEATSLFAGMLGSTRDTGGRLKPAQTSNLDPGAIAASLGGGGATGAGGGSAAGGAGAPGVAAPSAGAAAILGKWGASAGSGYNPSGAETLKIIQALKAAQAAGFSGDDLVTIVSIAGRESHWDPSSHRTSRPPKYPDPNSSLGGDRGLWQINEVHDDTLVKAGVISSKTPGGRRALMDPNVNARAAKVLFDRSNGNIRQLWGADKSGWNAKGNPLYNAGQYVQPVYNIAKQQGFVGDPFKGIPGAPSVYSMYSPVNNTSAVNASTNITAHISVGGGGMGDSDARRVGAVIADTLEAEMKARTARNF